MNTNVNIAAVRIRPSNDPLVNGLRTLMAECGPNKHVRAIVAISALIGQGFDTSDQMMPVLRSLGFNSKHIGIVLSGHTGANPARHYWRRDEVGVYTLLEDRAAA